MAYKSTGGIYIILNLNNNLSYIGSTVNFKKRRYEHFSLLLNNSHHSSKLQNAWNKYGKDSFVFKIIEECDREKCLEREQYYLDKYLPFYNICSKADNKLGCKHSDKTKELLSRNWKVKVLNRVEILSKSNYEKKRKEVIQLDKEGNIIQEYNSIREAGEALGLIPSQYASISKVCKNKEGRSQCYGFIWKYKNI